MASRFQDVTDTDVGAIKSATGNFKLLLAVYNLHNLQFMLQNVLSAWLERNVVLGQPEVCVKTKTQET